MSFNARMVGEILRMEKSLHSNDHYASLGSREQEGLARTTQRYKRVAFIGFYKIYVSLSY